MLRQWICNERGSVLIFTTALLIMLLVMGGMAVDLFYMSTADNELQRSLDFAALAGAGKLGFDDTVFGTVRASARTFGIANPLRIPGNSTVTLDLNGGNDAGGNIVLGEWDGDAKTFTPSLNGTTVNAVRCQYATSVSTSFLRLLGFNSLPVRAISTAISPVLALPPECPFPFAVDCTKFKNADGTWNSTGCGTHIQFISSVEDTAAWAIPLLSEPVPSASNIRDEINNPSCANPSDPVNGAIPTGRDVQVNNGMQDTSFEALKTKFTEMWNASGQLTVVRPNPSGGSDVTYTGKGWAGWAAVVCPRRGTGLSGELRIETYTKFVITQVIGFSGGNPQLPRPGFPANENGYCAVPNDADGNTWSKCVDPDIKPNFRGIYGYYSCEKLEAPPSGRPGPRASLANRVKLVTNYPTTIAP